MEQSKKITTEINSKRFDKDGLETPIQDLIDFLNESIKDGATHFIFKEGEWSDMDIDLKTYSMRDETEAERITREENELTVKKAKIAALEANLEYYKNEIKAELEKK